MFREIVQVVPNEDYTVTVYFDDGKIVLYNVKPLLDKKVFEPLKDKDIFIRTCTILNDTLAWDIAGDRNEEKCIDIDPNTLYDLPAIEDRIA